MSPDKELSLGTLKDLIGLVKRHVSVVASFSYFSLPYSHQPDIASLVLAMSTEDVDVSVIPEFPIPKTAFPGNFSFGGVVDLSLTKLPSRLGNPGAIDVPMTSTFFEAKRDNVRAGCDRGRITLCSTS
ncbi:hypothetical protein AX14_006169, partial [Amanita brunnescens Koide BX004]